VGPLRLSQRTVRGLTGDAEPLLTAAWLLPEDRTLPEQPVELDDAHVAFRVVDRVEPDPDEFEQRKSMLRRIQIPTKLNDVIPAWQSHLQKEARVVVNPRVLQYGG